MRRSLLAAVAACFVISGATGLVYEVVWSRMLTTFLGASSVAQIIVLSTFMAGLAIGNSLFGRLVDRHPARGLQFYAILELAIGLYALVFPALAGAAESAYFATTTGRGGTHIAELFVAAALLLPPTIAMGGTLPVLARSIVRSVDDVGRNVGLLYFLNSFGAVLGVTLSGFVLVPGLGSLTTLRATGLINLGIGCIALALHMVRKGRAELEAQLSEGPDEPVGVTTAGDDDERPPEKEPPDAVPGRIVLAGAALAGAAALGLEVCWARVFAIVFGSSLHAFTVVLAAFIAGIALGGAAAGRFAARRRRDAVRLAAMLLMGAAAVAALEMPFYERLAHWQFVVGHALERRESVFGVSLMVQALTAFFWMLPVATLGGAALPVLTRAYTRDDDSVGEGVGAVFSANTLGTVAGPLVAGFVLMPLLGLRGALWCAAFVYVGAAALLAFGYGFGELGSRGKAWFAGCAAVLVVVPLFGSWDPSVMHAGGFRRWTIEPGTTFAEFREIRGALDVLYNRDDATDSVVVLENELGERFMKVNGKTDASDSPDMATQRLVAHIPLLVHGASTDEAQRDVFVVGIGSGVTVGSAAMHADATVVTAELSRGVIEASRYFDHVSHDYTTLPNVEAHHADAREFLRRDERMWDVIINQPSNPWVAGNAALFSREFFDEAAARLDEGGVFAQWMHVYAMDDASLEIVMQTFASVFPYVTMWWPQHVDLILIGSMEPLDTDIARMADLLAASSVNDDIADLEYEGAHITTIGRLLSLQTLSEAGFSEHFDGQGLHTTDGFPRLEARAPRAQFVGERPESLESLDERLVPGATTRLLWGQDPTVLERDDLLEFFAARDTPFSDRIDGSLQHAVTGEYPELSDMPGMTTRATGMAVVLELWRDTLLDAPGVDAAECDAFAAAATTGLELRATAFYRPPVDEFRRGFWRCADADPDRGLVYRGLEAEMLVRTGYHAEAIDVLDGALARPLPEGARLELERLRDRAANGPNRGHND